jgi:predicted restriction endonuclease
VAGDKNYDPGDPRYWGLEEGRTPFEPEPAYRPGLETLRSLYATVLANYNYTCAMTGQHFARPAELLHDELEITPIRPMTAGGPLHVRNFLCLVTLAAQAFRDGHIAVGKDYQLVVDLSRIDPELVESLNANGRLSLPESEVGRPDPQALAYHRTHLFTGG